MQSVYVWENEDSKKIQASSKICNKKKYSFIS